MAETIINVSNFSMMMDGERFDASATVQNLDDYTWDIKAKGGVDIEKMMKIFPIEGMTLAGKVKLIWKPESIPMLRPVGMINFPPAALHR